MGKASFVKEDLTMKSSARFTRTISTFLSLAFLLAPLTVLAQTKVVVIPLFGDDPKP